MKDIIKINLVSTIVFILSLGAGIFLLRDYHRLQAGQALLVRGVRDHKVRSTQPTSGKKKNNNFDKNNLLLRQTIAVEKDLVPKPFLLPIKKEGVGQTYVRAKSAVAVDVDSEKILYDQNANRRLPIASLTKLMTALVVLDNLKDLSKEVVTIDQEVCSAPTSKIGCPTSTHCFSDVLHPGEKVKAQDLLEAMLVNSANDAAIALAKHIAGSQEKFAGLMNKKAQEIGLRNTHFCNPSGLDDEESSQKCYSSASDVAKIVVYALKNKRYQDLQRIFKIKEKWFNSLDNQKKHRFATTNILLDSMPNCLGAKTGFTYEAGKTLMMIASHPQNKEIKVVAVILNDPYRFEDAQKLFNWVFQSYKWQEVNYQK